MDKSQVKKVYDSKFIKLYDMRYKEGAHYYCASRREEESLPALLPEGGYKTLLPDAVSCIVVLHVKGESPKLLLNWEYRYPAGQYLLSVPAGLIDKEDLEREDALAYTAARELLEETGIMITPQDEIKIVNPFVFSTPGMTDEGNALVYIGLHRDKMPPLSQSGAVGSEKFDGFKIIDKKEAQEYLIRGRDEHGVYYPLYTWAALMFFLGIDQ